MSEALSHLPSPPSRGHIWEFENGKREPHLLVLLEYAKMAGISVDRIIDDELELLDKLPPSHRTK
jgi:transcriptional regulator with XRE-family HTH domain